MTDLSKRLREWGQPKGYPVCVFPDDPDVVGDRIVPARDMMEMWTLMARAADALDQPAWRPIAEAPRDGTPVLVFCPNEEPQIVAAKYVTDSEWSGWVFVEMLLQETMPEGPEGPTHFTPIPSPPGGE